jgi:hypothetical protein
MFNDLLKFETKQQKSLINLIFSCTKKNPSRRGCDKKHFALIATSITDYKF